MTRPRLSSTEFIALIAMLFATIAFSIDAMLPALPEITRELTPLIPNRAQLIITSFVLGMGIGTLVVGPISDSVGRKPVILGGALLYCAGALAAWAAPTLETMLLARLVQGLGAAGPRIVSLALVRDLYKGREMARVVSFAMMIFTLVPAVAPLVGTVIIAGFGWRGIFPAFIAFSAVSMLWFMLRQPETLPPETRRPLSARPLWLALREVMTHRVVLTAIAVQTLVFGCLFGTLSSTQQIFDVSFGRGAGFPFWFALIAVLAGSASFLNAVLVVRLGMRRLITVTLAAQIGMSALMAVMTWGGYWPPALAFPAYIAWTTGVFFMAGMTLGNLNALALEPMGHIAGLAASVSGAIATVLGVALAAPLGLAFDGTPVPLAFGVAVLAALGFGLMRTIPR
ncbi:multidrug effflux MFS transporter [Paracoccaceae bacterium Fryx2]|nr:multidrug effflux MFS transporter [Paracoccaceae bacterium Fryx2]